MVRRHAVIGYGRLARALVPALRAAGEQVVVGRRAPAEGESSPEAAAQAADWVWLTVPDDHIAATAAALRWRAGQLALHCSGATPLAAADASSHVPPVLVMCRNSTVVAGPGAGAAPARPAGSADSACVLPSKIVCRASAARGHPAARAKTARPRTSDRALAAALSIA